MGQRLLFTFLVLVTLGKSWAISPDFFIKESFLIIPDGYLSPLQKLGPEFDLEDLKLVIQKNEIQRISQLIPLLPPEFSGLHLTGHASQSLQCATAKAPRIIMFNSYGSLFCSFNSGNPEDYKDDPRGEACLITINHLECIGRKANGYIETHSFEFEPEVEYASQFLSAPVFNEELKESIGVVKHYQNPVICSGCHYGLDDGPSFRYSRIIFDQYFIWPGFDNAIDDNWDINKNQRDPEKVPAKEAENQKTYLALKNSNPRYRVIKHLSEMPEILGKDGTYSASYYAHRVNTAYTKLQSMNNIMRMFNILEALPKKNKLHPLMRAIAQECIDSIGEFSTYFAPEDQSMVLAQAKSIFASNREAADNHADNVLGRLVNLLGIEALKFDKVKNRSEGQGYMGPQTFRESLKRSLHEDRFLTYFRMLFEVLDYDSWQLTGNFDGSFAFEDGTSSFRNMNLIFRDYVQKYLKYSEPESCEVLKQNSQFQSQSLDL